MSKDAPTSDPTLKRTCPACGLNFEGSSHACRGSASEAGGTGSKKPGTNEDQKAAEAGVRIKLVEQYDESTMIELSEITLSRNPLLGEECFEGKYEYLGIIGAGGMGIIYKARQIMMDRLVAIKMLHSEEATRETYLRFRREAKATSLVSHAYIVPALDFGVTSTGRPYLVMGFVDGKTLADTLRDYGPLAMPRFLRIFTQVCDALGHAHAKNVLHRDIKPKNIMLVTGDDGQEEIRIFDFGIAKLMNDTESGGDVTRTGDALGSPMYMSPEQARGNKPDVRSDLYSLGCVMYEALTGVAPFVGHTGIDTLLMQINDEPRQMNDAAQRAAKHHITGAQISSNDQGHAHPVSDSPAKPVSRTKPASDEAHSHTIDKRMEEIIFRLLEKDPKKRFQSMGALLADLRAYQCGDTYTSRLTPVARCSRLFKRKRGKIIASATALAACAIAFIGFHHQPNTAKVTDVPTYSALGDLADSGAKDQLKAMLRQRQPNLELSKLSYLQWSGAALAPLNSPDGQFVKTIQMKALELKDDDLMALRDLKLEGLDLKLNDVANLKALDHMKSLRTLRVADTKINREGLRVISNLPELTTLDFSSTQIGDQDLPLLYPLHRLKSVVFYGCPHITKEGLAELRKHLPQCLIGFDTVEDHRIWILLHEAPEAASKARELARTGDRDLAEIQYRAADDAYAAADKLMELKPEPPWGLIADTLLKRADLQKELRHPTLAADLTVRAHTDELKAFQAKKSSKGAL